MVVPCSTALTLVKPDSKGAQHSRTFLFFHNITLRMVVYWYYYSYLTKLLFFVIHHDVMFLEVCRAIPNNDSSRSSLLLMIDLVIMDNIGHLDRNSERTSFIAVLREDFKVVWCQQYALPKT
jgi:hypothetical protein